MNNVNSWCASRLSLKTIIKSNLSWKTQLFIKYKARITCFSRAFFIKKRAVIYNANVIWPSITVRATEIAQFYARCQIDMLIYSYEYFTLIERSFFYGDIFWALPCESLGNRIYSYKRIKNNNGNESNTIVKANSLQAKL